MRSYLVYHEENEIYKDTISGCCDYIKNNYVDGEVDKLTVITNIPMDVDPDYLAENMIIKVNRTLSLKRREMLNKFLSKKLGTYLDVEYEDIEAVKDKYGDLPGDVQDLIEELEVKRTEAVEQNVISGTVPLNLDQAIDYCEGIVQIFANEPENEYAVEHDQITDWLKELRNSRVNYPAPADMADAIYDVVNSMEGYDLVEGLGLISSTNGFLLTRDHVLNEIRELTI